ncbi:hypothetical protein P154DRAFT_526118 [Amniculicola lignicola CBS 123094]|uniref:Uncharacterized protein n=1 Tax=Amniculicola lignicola CBS 123094 TaxID=1392246 RepID=A0A6A5W1Q5_9PLEO|nr:hypothetical protein P154DRAFT_526118 [Amniculicola lignicola CBS 123094]
MHPAYEGLSAMPFYDEFDLSTVDVLLISQYVFIAFLSAWLCCGSGKEAHHLESVVLKKNRTWLRPCQTQSVYEKQWNIICTLLSDSDHVPLLPPPFSQL